MLDGDSFISNATSMTDGVLSFFNQGSLNLEYLKVDDRVK
jgi:hypothetical protein